MGQAKQRGAREDRIRQAQERIKALQPDHLVCNNCQGTVNEIRVMDTRGIDGIDAAFAGTCPSCGHATYAARGTPEAMEEFAFAMDEVMGGEAKAGTQIVANSTRRHE